MGQPSKDDNFIGYEVYHVLCILLEGSYGSLKTMKVVKFGSYTIKYSKVVKFLSN